jgi:Transcriptional regulator, AbiEi antitoxin
LAIPLAGTGRGFGLSLIGEVCEQTGGYPYFLQFFGAFICSRIGLEHIQLADYQQVESALLHELDLAFFEDRFLGAAPAEQDLLLRMARPTGGQIRASDLRARTGDLPNLDELLRRLVRRGLLYRPSRGAYHFALPLFASYLRRHATSQRSQRL